ncbi:MAG: alpha-1,2-fucosyltransferase [Pelagibacteraceae bacterium]|jgi:hypothetical protein|nr:hypothetical protein [Candidatus Pelagibacter sp.]MDP6680143.1 alpha-1,2-fucosyltransferase [Pelagibacteraceae bacterium]MDP6710165.1 alpha-1,2-fucosyltransferase [Pelagibacteraceae bacterium]|tara:strand:+ start:5359 stop:6309 length:951 start_codon:yes stop_codon:yes gene_type:complete
MSKNLVVRISNGFGNQMFLYAAAYAFSKKLGYTLLIDDETGIKHDIKKRQKKRKLNWKPNYELEIFNLNSKIAEKKYKFLNAEGEIKRKFLKFTDKFTKKKNFLIEKKDNNKRTSYSNEYLVQKYKDTIYFEGYFESEIYFKEYRNDLLKEFSFKSVPDIKNNTFKKIIDDDNVVSIAIRRRRFTEIEGEDEDKTKVQKSGDFENITVNYIYRAIEYFKLKIKNPKFLIWSDNFENLGNYFDPHIYTFVENDSENKILLDFFLMCQCKYFIVGPTTFHWWAAWLCNNDKKVIVRPKDIELNMSSNINFWPDSWTKI